MLYANEPVSSSHERSAWERPEGAETTKLPVEFHYNIQLCTPREKYSATLMYSDHDCNQTRVLCLLLLVMNICTI